MVICVSVFFIILIPPMGITRIPGWSVPCDTGSGRGRLQDGQYVEHPRRVVPGLVEEQLERTGLRVRAVHPVPARAIPSPVPAEQDRDDSPKLWDSSIVEQRRVPRLPER